MVTSHLTSVIPNSRGGEERGGGRGGGVTANTTTDIPPLHLHRFPKFISEVNLNYKLDSGARSNPRL